jgi:hypothetical protein
MLGPETKQMITSKTIVDLICRNRCRPAAEHWLVPDIGGTGFP